MPPVKVAIAGGHATRSAIRAAQVVDVTVEMPVSCFEHKDHLNHRYHVKRALYLTVLSQQLAKHTAFADQQWACFNHDARCISIAHSGGLVLWLDCPSCIVASSHQCALLCSDCEQQLLTLHETEQIRCELSARFH